MDITLENLAAELPALKAAMHAADFIALDTELSGIHLDASVAARYHGFTPLQERYRLQKLAAERYVVTQLGLAAFTRSTTIPGVYEVRAFNIYTFPRQSTRRFEATKKHFSVEPQALEFLDAHGFDFNRWIKGGVPYLTMEGIASLRRQREHVSSSDPSDMKTTSRDVEFLERVVATVNAWLEAGGEEVGDTYVDVEPANAFLRRLLHQELPRRFPQRRLQLQSLENAPEFRTRRDRQMRVSLLTAEEAAASAAREEAQFLVLSDVLPREGVPIVVHNGWTDLCMVYAQFYGALPETLGEFKELVRAAFGGGVVDTKYIAEHCAEVSAMVMNSSLQEVFEQLRANSAFAMGPQPRFAAGFDKYRANEAGADSADPPKPAHEAAFDAFCTGEVFLKAAWYLGHKELEAARGPADSVDSTPEGSPPSASALRNASDASRCWLVEFWNGSAREDGEEVEAEAKVDMDAVHKIDWAALKEQWNNKVFVMRHEDLRHFRLDADDVVPDRSHVFHVRGLPVGTSQHSVIAAFTAALGGPEAQSVVGPESLFWHRADTQRNEYFVISRDPAATATIHSALQQQQQHDGDVDGPEVRTYEQYLLAEMDENNDEEKENIKKRKLE